METIIDQHFKTAEGKQLGRLRRTIKVNFTPAPHAYIEDSVWKAEKRINKVIMNPLSGYVKLEVDDEILATEDFGEVKKMYLLHKWE